MIRRICGLAVLGSVMVGCASGPFARQASIPPAYQGEPTAQKLIEHLNQNASAVQSIECSRVDIQARQGIQSLGVDAMLAYEKPRNFRLMAKAVGTTQADMGSNGQEFWFWIKNADPPGLRYCSYEDLPRARNVPIPIHPDWIAEALCVTEFGPADQYQIRTTGRQFELVTRSTSPQGQPLQKITVIDRNSGRIAAHRLLNAEGKEIWSARIEQYHTQLPGYVVPRVVRLVSTADRIEMRLKLDGCKVNGRFEGRPELFVRPQMAGAIDLAGGARPAPPQATPQSFVRIGGPQR